MSDIIDEKAINLIKQYKSELKDIKPAFILGLALNIIDNLQNQISDRDDIIQKIIDRLNMDYERIGKVKNDGKHCDDYSRCRLKAYRTKTKEIKEYIEKEYFKKESNV